MDVLIWVVFVLMTAAVAFLGLFRPQALYQRWLRNYERYPGIQWIPVYRAWRRAAPKWHIATYRATGLLALGMCALLILAPIIAWLKR